MTEEPYVQFGLQLPILKQADWLPREVSPSPRPQVGSQSSLDQADTGLRVRELEVAGPLVIGYSVEGRPLEVFRFGNGDRKLLIVAGIHGGYEWNTIALADELIEYLKSHQELIPADLQLHILRSLNPDGEARAHNFLGRGNANNVDLNRNWNVHWTSILPQFGCWNFVRLSGGSHPISEPETKALMDYILETEFEAVISYHSAGLGIFAGGLPSSDKSRQLAEAIAEVSPYPYPPIDIGCEYTGTFTDWAAWIGMAAVDIELSTHFYTDFEQNLRVLDVFLHWSPVLDLKIPEENIKQSGESAN